MQLHIMTPDVKELIDRFDLVFLPAEIYMLELYKRYNTAVVFGRLVRINAIDCDFNLFTELLDASSDFIRIKDRVMRIKAIHI